MTTISTTQMQPYNGEPIPDDGQYLVRYQAKSIGDEIRFKFDTARFKDGKPFIIGNHFHWDICKQITHIVKIVE